MKIYRNLVLNINDIKVDRNLMPKEKLTGDIIQNYIDSYKYGCHVPPLTVCHVPNKGFLLIDGFHRLAAAKKAGLKVIQTFCFSGTYNRAMLIAKTINKFRKAEKLLKEKGIEYYFGLFARCRINVETLCLTKDSEDLPWHYQIEIKHQEVPAEIICSLVQMGFLVALAWEKLIVYREDEIFEEIKMEGDNGSYTD